MLAILLFLAVFFLERYQSLNEEPGKIQERFQTCVTESFRDVAWEVRNLQEKFFKNEKELSFWKDGLQLVQTSDKNDIALFVLRKDSMLFWSDSKVIFPADFFRNSPRGDFIVKLKTGWYGFHCQQEGPYLFAGSYLIKNEYLLQNEYLVNGYSGRFEFPQDVCLSLTPGKFPIFSGSHNYLCSLIFIPKEAGHQELAAVHQGQKGQGVPLNVIFLVFFLGLIFLLRAIFLAHTAVDWFGKRRNLQFLSFLTIVLILRVLQFLFRFPAELCQSALFDPSWYSSSVWLPSLGDFVINALLGVAMVLAFFTNKSSSQKLPGRSHGNRIFRGLIVGSMVLIFFEAAGYFITDLVINSSLPLNLKNISALIAESGFGFFIIAAVLFILWKLSHEAFTYVFSLSLERPWLLVSSGISIILNMLVFQVLHRPLNYPAVLLFTGYFLVYGYLLNRENMKLSIQISLFFLCFFAVFATVILNQANRQKEGEKRNLLAVKLASRRNPVTEEMYDQLERRILTDSLLRGRLQPGAGEQQPGTDSLISYLKAQYFRDYWRKYNVQITLCDTSKNLLVQPRNVSINCNSYFSGIINKSGEETVLPNLFFLDNGLGKEYYLAILTGSDFGLSGPVPTLFIEINSKNDYPDPGYPGLLMDNTRIDIPNLSDYSYGLYENGRLVHAVGSYNYSIGLNQYGNYSKNGTLFKEDEMVHYQYRINPSTSLLISKKKESFLSRITPFSYLFILFALISLVAGGLVNFPKTYHLIPRSLRTRLHISLIGILVVAMAAIGVVQVLNITGINSKKNADNLRERALSVLVEIQHKYGAEQEIPGNGSIDLEDFLIRLSNIFFTDINFYDAEGTMISSSRPQIFEEGLVSGRMDPEAYKSLVVDRNSILIHHESIGTMQFNSAYLPLYNDQNNLLGYINLPYFSRQDELKKEISSFLVTFINIYILLILFGIFITILISNYITAPLALLAGKMSRLRLGKVNEKITWNPHDEIGQLVTEYNRMVDELGRSAAMLAQSEREMAWRGMARQVAHEIKNPLTPMKLSAQYLQKAWNDKAPDWDKRLARFTATLVEQIDALSAIATDFSDFAKISEVAVKKVDLVEIARFSLSLYEGASEIRYELFTGADHAMVLADRSQLIRVFTNLLNNAMQAIDDKQGGLIRVTLVVDKEDIVVAVSDNGTGISPGRADKIFEPDFTTKTGGMGLGLAIVKGIVEGIHGTISFTSEEQKGTTFVIKIPAYVEPV